MLRSCSGGASELRASATTVGEALRQLKHGYGNLYRSVSDETGAVRRHVNIFVNDSNIRDMEMLDTRLAAGDVITIMPAVSGGSTWRNV